MTIEELTALDDEKLEALLKKPEEELRVIFAALLPVVQMIRGEVKTKPQKTTKEKVAKTSAQTSAKLLDMMQKLNERGAFKP